MTGFDVRPLGESTWPDFARLESQGFERIRRLGKNHWVVAKVVPGDTGRG